MHKVRNAVASGGAPRRGGLKAAVITLVAILGFVIINPHSALAINKIDLVQQVGTGTTYATVWNSSMGQTFVNTNGCYQTVTVGVIGYDGWNLPTYADQIQVKFGNGTVYTFNGDYDGFGYQWYECGGLGRIVTVQVLFAFHNQV